MIRKPRNRRRLNIRHEYQPQMLVARDAEAYSDSEINIVFTTPLPTLTGNGLPAMMGQFGQEVISWERPEGASPDLIRVTFSGIPFVAGNRITLDAWDPAIRTRTGGYIAPFFLEVQ